MGALAYVSLVHRNSRIFLDAKLKPHMLCEPKCSISLWLDIKCWDVLILNKNNKNYMQNIFNNV